MISAMIPDHTQTSRPVSLSGTHVAPVSISARRAEWFLGALVNMDPGDERKRRRFCERFPGLLPTRAPDRPPDPEEPHIVVSGNPYWFLWEVAIPALRALWAKPAAEAKEADLMMLTSLYMGEWARAKAAASRASRSLEPVRDPAGGASLTEGPDAFVKILLHALKNSHRLKYCANPKCVEPYFFACRTSQICCSPPCAEPRHRENKSRWWREHGEAYRKKRGKRKNKAA
jgi:hypothetical protein